MNISVLIPTHRLKWAQNIIDNVRRQRVEGFRLDVVVVLNGDAQSEPFDGLRWTLLRSRTAVTDARNVALEHARRSNPDGLFAFMDQDDWYGPQYLVEMFAHRDKADVIGKANCFYEMSDGQVVLLDVEQENTYTDAVRGPTMAGWVGRVPNFPECNGWGEDNLWMEAIARDGGTLYATSRFSFMGKRHVPHEHTWCIADVDLAMCGAKRVYAFPSRMAALSGAPGEVVDDLLGRFDQGYGDVPMRRVLGVPSAEQWTTEGTTDR